MSKALSKTLDEIRALLFSGMVILTLQKFVFKSEMDMLGATVGMLIIIAISVLSLKIKERIPLDIPAFAWASLIALLLSTPFSPVQETFLGYTNQVVTGMISTVILAVAGISIGTRLNDMKKLSWKIFLVSVVVFTGTFFGSAIVSQIILKLQGII